MFAIQLVKLTNFRSYTGEHVFEFPLEPGLYQLTGSNQSNPRLGSNGSGKTTLLEAIYWCLYGRTTRGLRAGDVINWQAKGCTVTTSLTVGQTRLEITRSQAPNSLTLNGEPVEQHALEKALRLTPEAFTHSVLIPQFGASFFDLSPAAKLTLFSDIMELEYWLEKSQAADKLAAEIARDKAMQEQTAAKYRGQLEVIDDDLKQLEVKNKAFADAQRVAIERIDSESQSVDTDRLQQNILEVGQALKVLQAKLQKAAVKCPTCGQPTRSADVVAINRNITDFERELSSHQCKLASEQARKQELKAAAYRERARTNPYTGMMREKAGQKVALKAELSTLQTVIEQLAEEHAAVSYWITGFKRIRLFIIEETLRQLEIEVNNSLGSLGLLDWRVQFDVERENRSGGITRGFIVLVYAPGREEPIRFEAFSGGETQRLRLAGDLGLANLIMERAGLTNTIELFDEPSEHLSQEGLLDLADTLHQRAMSQGKQIWIIDHSLIDYPFTATRRVFKDQRGSRFDLT